MKKPQIVLCAGLKSSGSTWLYNAVIQLARASARLEGKRIRLCQFYADDVLDFPAAARSADILIVKTHIPSAALQFLTHFTGGRVLLTIREPRDAIASLLLRFEHRFEDSLAEVAAGAAALVALAESGDHMLLRYEDRFCEHQAVLRRIARHLDVEADTAVLETIHRSLQPDRVDQAIFRLGRKGVFGRGLDPDRFDPKTHWHPGHIGDGRIGKFDEELSAVQQNKVLTLTRAYCLYFGYSLRRARPRTQPRRTGGKRRSRH